MTIGNVPLVDTVVLTAGADFKHRFNVAGGDELPLGTLAQIRFYDSLDTDAEPLLQLDATNITADYAEFRSESEVVDDIEAKSFFRVYVIYPDDPTFENCWYRGKVRRDQ